MTGSATLSLALRETENDLNKAQHNTTQQNMSDVSLSKQESEEAAAAVKEAANEIEGVDNDEGVEGTFAVASRASGE